MFIIKQVRNPWSTNCVCFSAPTRPPLPKSGLIHHEVQRVCWLVQRPLHYLPRGNQILQHRSGHFPLVRRCRPLLGRRGLLVAQRPQLTLWDPFPEPVFHPDGGVRPHIPWVHRMGPESMMSKGPEMSNVQCPGSPMSSVQCPVSWKSNVQCP